MIRRLGLSALAAQALALVEVLLVLGWEHRRVASIWEGERGVLWLLPTLIALATPLGIVGGVLDRALVTPGRVVRALLSAGAGLAAFAVGWGVGGGRHLASVGVRCGFALVLGALATALVFALSPSLQRLRRERPARFALGVLVAVVVLELANRFVLVRLYPAFHLALTAAALVLSPCAVLPLADVPGVSRSTAPWALPLVLAAALGLAVPATARHLSHFDNFRLILLESSPVGARAVELAARIAPPPAWDDASLDTPLDSVSAGTAGSLSLDLRGRDILLVTIDALRADHVSAYGYGRPTTRVLDALAAEGATFAEAYTTTPHTSYAITSLMTGKYMRPLLLQGMGLDSDTWAGLLRTYGYRTAAFYPPAVFFIDGPRFQTFSERALDFEYRWVEFTEGEPRVEQLRKYLAEAPRSGPPTFAWVHLFGPHEPYEAHSDHPFGEQDIDRYDSEIAEADATLGRLKDTFLAAHPRAVVIVTADHGEEFGDHGGRYHGTSVYEEQVRVPLVIWAPGLVKPARIGEPVQLVDLLPTVLGGLDIPRPPRLRGRDLGPLLAGTAPQGAGFAYAETDDQAMVASGSLRLVCARRIGACQLFDLASDPAELRDLANARPADRDRLREKLREMGASHGRYELGGLRAEGKGWPAPIRRALAGDGEAAPDVAELLDDAELDVRRKAAEVLFELRQPAVAPALRLALGREEDAEAKAWEALALTRLGQGAPLVGELLEGTDARFRRLAALALGESGDKRGEAVLVDWWMHPDARDFMRSREILQVFGELKTKAATGPLVQSLGDVRLRPHIARTLARIGDDSARGALLRALTDERLQSTRLALAEAMVDLGAKDELAAPLRRFLGTPDPLPNGLGLAVRAKVLEYVGGPTARDLAKLNQHADLGQAIEVTIPPGGNGRGVRLLVRATSSGMSPGEVRVSAGTHLVRFDRDGNPKRQHGVPALDEQRAQRLLVPRSDKPVEVHATVPAALGLRPGLRTAVVVYASSGVALEAVAFVPLTDELPPPPPKPWTPDK